MDAVIPPSKKLTEPQIRADRVRLTLFLYRKQGMSSEEFSNYWRGEHSQIFANLPVVKKYLLTYEQVRLSAEPSSSSLRTCECARGFRLFSAS